MARFYKDIVDKLPNPVEYVGSCAACWDPDISEGETPCVIAAKFPYTEWYKSQEIWDDDMACLEIALSEEDRKFSITEIVAEYVCPVCGCAYMNYYSDYPNDLITDDTNYFESDNKAYDWLEQLRNDLV